jgi:hypothetical protein
MKRSLWLLAVCLALALCGASSPSSLLDPSSPAFRDIPSGTLWGGAVTEMTAQGYFHGKSEGVFAPFDGASRAEMAVLLLRAAHGADYNPGPARSQWWEPWCHEAEAEGLMASVSDADAPATRADVAVLMWLMARH